MISSLRIMYRIWIGTSLNPTQSGRNGCEKRNDSMKHLALAVSVLVMTAPFALAQNTSWVSDQAHSEVDFTVTHLTISNVHGKFGKVNARIELDSADITKSSVAATIDVSTVDTGETGRDNDLRGASFFDVAQFPTATFTSTSVKKSGSGLSVAGNFTLHGVTLPVTLAVEGPNGPVTGMGGKQHAGFSATTTISRIAFGIGPKMPAAMVGDDVKLVIDLDVVKQ
jgi:polyisoprenoid-binding protein YceI